MNLFDLIAWYQAILHLSILVVGSFGAFFVIDLWKDARSGK